MPIIYAKREPFTLLGVNPEDYVKREQPRLLEFFAYETVGMARGPVGLEPMFRAIDRLRARGEFPAGQVTITPEVKALVDAEMMAEDSSKPVIDVIKVGDVVE